MKLIAMSTTGRGEAPQDGLNGHIDYQPWKPICSGLAGEDPQYREYPRSGAGAGRDPVREAAEWDRLIAAAFPDFGRVAQPLWELVEEKDEVQRVLAVGRQLPSGLRHYLAANRL